VPAQSADRKTHAQLPSGDEIFLDHVGHFVADASAAAEALAQAGFSPTPVSIQVNPSPDGGPPRPTGTGNVCAMLRGGYLEVLFKSVDTPLGREHDAARQRYDGLHLVAFAVADAPASHGRLAAAGFPMQPLVSMQRPVETVDGPDTAAFEVVRVVPGAFAEGRVQMLRHRTERTVWQPRWLDHPNGALGLVSLAIVVADPAEAAGRFARFTGYAAETTSDSRRITLDRGTIELLSTDQWHARWPDVTVPSLPFMGACTIAVDSLARTRAYLEAGRLALLPSPTGLAARFPHALGHGVWLFVEG